MSWSTAVAKIAEFLTFVLKKFMPSAAEEAKKKRQEAEENFKDFLKESDLSQDS